MPVCGVIAVVGRGSESSCRLGLGSMSHRGVRSSVVDGPGWSLGHRRLPIVGVGAEHDQPVRRGRWVVGFVGEVLDFRERDPEYECDAELVADLWAEHGPTCLSDRDGFWSVVACDERDGSVHAIVDYFSQKPMYVRDDGIRAVASEPNAVAGLGPAKLDQIYLSAVVKWGYCPETWRTPYEGVRRMGPGEYARIPREGPIEWSVVDRLLPTPMTTEVLKSEIESAVRRRVTSRDVPMGCLVSGGLDSAIAWTLASRYGDVESFHVENGEVIEAEEVAGRRLTALPLGSVGSIDALRYMQEPVDLGSLVPQVALSRVMEGRVTVALTGDGADELFGGYSRASRYDSQASDVWHELVAWHLPRLDRVMMRGRVEVRSPFLARGVASAALALPRDARIDKRVLRDLFRMDLPPGVVDRVKRPLRTPDVSRDREARSVELVDLFQSIHEESSCRRWS